MSATNGTTRSECSQQSPLQTTRAWQAHINGLLKQWEKDRKAELKEQKWRHDLKVKELKEKVKKKVFGKGKAWKRR